MLNFTTTAGNSYPCEVTVTLEPPQEPGLGACAAPSKPIKPLTGAVAKELIRQAEASKLRGSIGIEATKKLMDAALNGHV